MRGRIVVVCVVIGAALVAAVSTLGFSADSKPRPDDHRGGRPAGSPQTSQAAVSAAQPFALLSEANRRYVTVETGDGGGRSGTLRARSASVGPHETFTVHTADLGASATLRSVANGRYVTAADDGDTDATARGALRAQAATAAGDGARFELEAVGSGRYALRSLATGRYVNTDVVRTGDQAGMLQAAAASSAGQSAGKRESYRLVPVPAPVGEPPPAAAGADRAADTVSVMSWNICSNVGGCPLFRATPTAITDAVVAAATTPFSPDVVMVQEFCEKDAKPLELALEAETGRTWDVRFAPIRWVLAGSVKAQRLCDPDTDGADRGAYGMALGVPGASTWHAAIPLTSPTTDEQRAVLCATLESRALNLCTSHFSSTSAADDPTGTYRVRQLGELLAAIEKPGYRVVFGGDFNLTPPAAPARAAAPQGAMDPAYDAYEECDQSAYDGRRTGTPTYSTSKIDYIFGPTTATFRCQVAPPNTHSDHRPIYATVALPGR